MSTAWRVPRDWAGDTVAILASGPSMTRETADFVQGRCRVIAINNQGIDTTVNGVLQRAFAPWADMLWASDAKWWVQYADRALKFCGVKATAQPAVPYSEVLSLIPSRNVPFDPSPEHVVTGGNSGYAALHVAVQRGASRVLLLGYDMREVEGARHWFGRHEGRLETSQRYANWIQRFSTLAPVLAKMGVEVLNCTKGSALRCFPCVPVQEALK